MPQTQHSGCCIGRPIGLQAVYWERYSVVNDLPEVGASHTESRINCMAASRLN